MSLHVYTSAIIVHNPTPPIKSAEEAEALRQLIALDLKFMVGCDCEWFPAPRIPLSMPLCLALKPFAGSVFSRRRLPPCEPRPPGHVVDADILTQGGLPRGLRRYLRAGGTLTSRRLASL